MPSMHVAYPDNVAIYSTKWKKQKRIIILAPEDSFSAAS